MMESDGMEVITESDDYDPYSSTPWDLSMSRNTVKFLSMEDGSTPLNLVVTPKDMEYSYESSLKDADVAMTCEDILFEGKVEESRLRLLRYSPLFQNNKRSQLNVFIRNPNIVETLNSIDHHKLELLVKYRRSAFDFDFDNKDVENFKNILQNPRSASIINSINLDKLIAVNPSLDLHIIDIILFIINNDDSIDVMNLIDVERFTILLNYDEGCLFSVLKAIIKDRNVANAINSLDLDRLKLINKIGKFSGGLLAKIFGDAKNVVKIQSMTYERLKHTLECGKMCLVFLGKQHYHCARGIELIYNHDMRYDECYPNDPDLKHHYFDLDLIDIEKLRIMVESDMVDDTLFYKLLESTEESIEMINLIDIDKLSVLVNHNNITESAPPIKRTPGELNKDWIHGATNPNWTFAIGWEDVLGDFFLSVIYTPGYVDRVNSIETERLELLIKTIHNYKTSEYVRGLIHDPEAFEIVKRMNIKKLSVLLKFYGIKRFSKIIDEDYGSEILDLIELLNVEKLGTTISMLSFNDLIYISKCFNSEVRQNLNFVIVLYKAGIIKFVNYNLLLDRKTIEDEIRKLFPSNFPINRILVPPFMENKGNVSNLKYLCLEALMNLVTEIMKNQGKLDVLVTPTTRVYPNISSDDSDSDSDRNSGVHYVDLSDSNDYDSDLRSCEACGIQ